MALTLGDDALGLGCRLVHRGDRAVIARPGRPAADADGPVPDEADRLHAAASALLLAAHRRTDAASAELRYADGTILEVRPDEADRARVRALVEQTAALRAGGARPPIHPDEAVCVACPLVPVCLPDEVRLAAGDGPTRPLHPPAPRRRTLHVTDQGARVARVGRRLRVTFDGEVQAEVGARQLSDVALHGHVQISTQAMRLCADEGIPVHLLTAGGQWIGAFGESAGAPARRIGQYAAVTDEAVALDLARQIVEAKMAHQRRQLMRASRADAGLRARVAPQVEWIDAVAGAVRSAPDRAALMGREGQAARAWFTALAALVDPARPALRPDGRSRRPPRDRFNALLSFGYGLLRRDMHTAILRVGLDPALGVLHGPRTTAPPLALDLMELFRVPVVDAAVLAAVNQGVFDVDADFELSGADPAAPTQVWLSPAGRKKLIGVYARRKHTEVQHPVTGAALSFARMMELEVRLLEKSWSGEPGLFARYRPR